jgi:hypothetical protein
MEIVYVLVRQRRQFGRFCAFTDQPAELLHSLQPDPQAQKDHLEKNPCKKLPNNNINYIY